MNWLCSIEKKAYQNFYARFNNILCFIMKMISPIFGTFLRIFKGISPWMRRVYLFSPHKKLFIYLWARDLSSSGTGKAFISPSYKIFPTGLTMAAVPVPNISSKLPVFAPSKTSWMVNFLSLMSNSFHSWANSAEKREEKTIYLVDKSREL